MQRARLILALLFQALLIMAAGAGARANEPSRRQPLDPIAHASGSTGDEDDRVAPGALNEALRRGEIRPLERVLAAVRARFPGEVIAIEAERRQAGLAYEVKLLGDDGRRRTIIIDARTLGMAED